MFVHAIINGEVAMTNHRLPSVILWGTFFSVVLLLSTWILVRRYIKKMKITFIQIEEDDDL